MPNTSEKDPEIPGNSVIPKPKAPATILAALALSTLFNSSCAQVLDLDKDHYTDCSGGPTPPSLPIPAQTVPGHCEALGRDYDGSGCQPEQLGTGVVVECEGDKDPTTCAKVRQDPNTFLATHNGVCMVVGDLRD